MATAMASSWGGRISINGSKPQTPNTDRTSSDQAVMIPILVRPTLLTYSSAFENGNYRAAKYGSVWRLSGPVDCRL